LAKNYTSFLIALLFAAIAMSPESSAAESAGQQRPTEISSYNSLVISSTFSDHTATLALQLNPERESLIEVRGQILDGFVNIGIRLPSQAHLMADFKAGNGNVWRWKVRDVSVVDVDFRSTANFRFRLISIKVFKPNDLGPIVPLSPISGASGNAD
jgi:hypothetical protein